MLLILLLFSVISLTGCVSTKDAYIDFYGEYAEMSGGIDALETMGITQKLLTNIAVNLRPFAIIGSIASELLGWTLIFAIKKNKNITKVAIIFFCIGLPILLFGTWLGLSLYITSVYF